MLNVSSDVNRCSHAFTQKLDAETEKIVKKQAKYEKDDVQMRERKEHLTNKKEKALASLERVSNITHLKPASIRLTVFQDREARTAARQAIKSHSEDLIKRKQILQELEKQLKKEEKTLEEINLELKGKTDGYMAEIEKHQKELAPWTDKINEKKKTIDIKKSEREILSERMQAGEKAVEEAKQQLKKIEELLANKVHLSPQRILPIRCLTISAEKGKQVYP